MKFTKALVAKRFEKLGGLTSPPFFIERIRMAKYRKKPIIIEATQWFKNGDHPEDNPELLKETEK